MGEYGSGLGADWERTGRRVCKHIEDEAFMMRFILNILRIINSNVKISRLCFRRKRGR